MKGTLKMHCLQEFGIARRNKNKSSVLDSGESGKMLAMACHGQHELREEKGFLLFGQARR